MSAQSDFPNPEAVMIARDPTPAHISPTQWTQAMGIARQVCARIFRDGGAPGDAVVLFGLAPADTALTWDTAVERVATEICAEPMRRAA